MTELLQYSPKVKDSPT